ncbi:YncE family protein [Pseudomonas sp. UMAB-40]|uniref:YncE family protein n=1 Tax=Pseudomonas sp. UMAB-40 TaxID=1365407 RepID=UPI001C56F56F|nr:YncE family protein [Pseudomonas sp. UMAB-40]
MQPQSPTIAQSPTTLSNENVHMIHGYDDLVISKDSARLYFRERIGEEYYLRAMDANTQKVIATYSAGRWPTIKGLSPDSTKAFAMDITTACLFEINTINHTVGEGTKIDSRPLTDMVIHPTGIRAYLCAGDDLIEFDTVEKTEVRKLPLSYPDNLAISPSGTHLYVSCWNEGRQNSIEVIDTARLSVIASIPLAGFPSNITVSPDGKLLYALNKSDREMIVIDAVSNKTIKVLQHSTATRSICCSRDGNQLFTVRTNSESVFVLDAKTLQETQRFNTGKHFLTVIKMSPDKANLYVLYEARVTVEEGTE